MYSRYVTKTSLPVSFHFAQGNTGMPDKDKEAVRTIRRKYLAVLRMVLCRVSNY